MSEVRKYYTVPIPHPYEQDTRDLCFCDGDNREKNDGSLLFVKTTQSIIDAKVASGVSLDKLFPIGTTEYDYAGAAAVVQSPDWAPL